MDNDWINAALDIQQNFVHNPIKKIQQILDLNPNKSATNSEVSILGEYLRQWCNS